MLFPRPFFIYNTCQNIWKSAVRKTKCLKNNSLSQQQYGSRNNHSIPLDITDLFENLFFRSKKAFDSVNQAIFLTKIEHYGVRGNAIELI